DLTALCPFWCPLLSFRELALNLCKFLLFLSKEARISDFLAIRQGCERREANIDANRPTLSCKRLWRCFNAQAGIPFPCSRAPERDRLDLSSDRPMHDDLNRPDLAQREGVPFQAHTVAILRVGDTVIAAKALEARVADFLFACLEATKERLEC